MATAAVSSKLSVMNVMRAVARAATSVDGFYSFQRATMTFIAANAEVGSRNRKFRLQVVIESYLVPGNRVMALPACPIKVTAMRIFFFVAGNAFRLGVPKGLVRMAINAFFLAVLAEQWKRSQFMVKKHRILPVNFGMAVLALCAERLFVGIIVQVAAIACCVERHFKNGFNMATTADHLLVCAIELVVGLQVVIEGRFCPV
jgi:hypothetical protein